jgi:hypothetical protein
MKMEQKPGNIAGAQVPAERRQFLAGAAAIAGGAMVGKAVGA